MDKGWYTRLVFIVTLVVLAWLTVWGSLDKWVPVPQSVAKVFDNKIALGLDIKGGLRLMYEVEVDEAVRDRRELRADQILRKVGQGLGIIPEGDAPTREQLTQVREQVTLAEEGERHFRLTFKDAAKLQEVNLREAIDFYGDLREEQRTNTSVQIGLREESLEKLREDAVAQARDTIADRIDKLGMAQSSVTAQGTDIIVEVPGAEQDDFDRIRDIIAKTARLEFKIVADDSSFVAGLKDLPEGITREVENVSAGVNKPSVASSFLMARGPESREKLTKYIEGLRQAGSIPEHHDLLVGRAEGRDSDDAATKQQEAWRTYLLHSQVEVTGQAIEEAFVANDPQTNKPYVALNFNSAGAESFRQLTGSNVKRRMAIVLDDRVESAPNINEEIGGGRCQITLGGYRPYNEIINEANDLVIVLKAGALPVPIRPANEQMIGPTLGLDGVEKGIKGGLVGVALVLVFMLAYYQVAGAIADLMVVLNLLFLLAILAAFEATLTLPGIAAMALNIGMAVDANVLITERIREELRNGKSSRAAVDQGYGRAFWAIIDSQFTTFIAGVVLLQFGTGPLKGFALTLIIGIMTSLFSGVFCSRVLFDWLARGLRVQRLKVG